ncbi:MAG TPA: ribosome assembly RNA-binding protein YhbY [Candidatus Borkfalkia excrementavium]|uniref:Ribosome assembly RNA-binding protein YhbY n=1 Tax=Candidatus Borkfalkia excrementavium TaxID=2838505 RepID=A0A9D1Z770_9FIRM|nr:ribosome assembly RNA-binding protein YhbY [Candidatus Borkfalkia excrementavium]
MTSKQRSNLKSIAANLQPIAQLGKGGVGENMLRSLSDALEAHELIKINVLGNASEDAKDLGAALAEQLGAECVAVIGHKIILYRRSSRKDFDHIVF